MSITRLVVIVHEVCFPDVATLENVARTFETGEEGGHAFSFRARRV